MARKGRGTDLTKFSDGRDENNLAEFPLSVLSDTVPDGLKTLEFEDTVSDWKTGQTITRKVCITGSDKFGLPRPKDEDVLLALVQLTKIANNFTSPEVHFTKRQLLQILDWETTGWAYERLEESLHRWKGVSVHYKSAWRDNARGKWCDSEALGVIEYVKLTDGRQKVTGDGSDGQCRIIWNKALFDSFASGYLKRLDYGTYRSLERPAARRAFRFLDKRFHHKPDWEFELRAFACEKIGLSRSYDTGQLKERLKPALGELERIGFIAPVRYHKERPKVWRIAISKAEAKANAECVEHSELAELLINRGIAAEIATQLVAEFSAEQIRQQVAIFDWYATRNDKRISKNPPGFLAAAIRKNYQAPKEFLETVKPRRSKANATPVQRSTAKRAAEDSAMLAIREHISRLSSEEIDLLTQTALAGASRFQHDTFRRLSEKGGKLWAECRDGLLIDYLRRNPERIAKSANIPTAA